MPLLQQQASVPRRLVLFATGSFEWSISTLLTQSVSAIEIIESINQFYLQGQMFWWSWQQLQGESLNKMAQTSWLHDSVRVSSWDPPDLVLELTNSSVSVMFAVGEKKQYGKKCFTMFNHKNCNVRQQWCKLLTSAELDGRGRRPQFSLGQSSPAATHLSCHNHINCAFSYLHQHVCVFATSGKDCLFCLSAGSNMTCECGSVFLFFFFKGGQAVVHRTFGDVGPPASGWTLSNPRRWIFF